jgi:hypothetical protein
MLIDDNGFPVGDDGLMEWGNGMGVVIRRHPGTELRDGEFKPINLFGLFYQNAFVCDGTFEYVSGYYWREFAPL